MRLLKARGKLSHADLVTLLPSSLPRGCLNTGTTTGSATGSSVHVSLPSSLPRGCLNTGTTTGSRGTGSDVHVSLEPELFSKCVEYLLDKEYIELEKVAAPLAPR